VSVEGARDADELTIGGVELTEQEVSAEIRVDERSFPLWFRVENGSFGRDLDFLVPVTLLPAMRLGADLTLPGPVSPQLAASVPKLQEIFSLWNEAYGTVPVEVPTGVTPRQGNDAVGCFFSGGVDSFYSTVHHRDEITHLIFVNVGFDRPDPLALDNVRGAAEELGKPLIEIETNLRSFSNSCAVEMADYGGAALAVIGLLLQDEFKKVMIGSTFSYFALPRWGSHPLTDPLWSTESLEVFHAGAEATRPEKVALIASDDVAMRRLRVCHPRAGETGRSLNCGRCSKCLRTMINLRVVGALGRCQTLPAEFDLRDVEELEINDDRDLAFMLENLRELDRDGRDEPLADALRSNLERHGRPHAEVRGVDLDDAWLMRRRLHHAERTVRKRDRELHQLKSSLGWRMMAPVRAIGRARSRR
jgi:hypothetical protein